jgi:hypothetical protein
VDLGILGATEVRGAGGRPVAVGGPRVRALPALLLLDAGRVVPTGRLIAGLYGEDPPPGGAANALQSQVSRLRRGLARGLLRGDPAGPAAVATGSGPSRTAAPRSQTLLTNSDLDRELIHMCGLWWCYFGWDSRPDSTGSRSMPPCRLTSRQDLASLVMMSKTSSTRFPVTVTRLPVVRCEICRRTVAYRPGQASAVLTEHYAKMHPGALGQTPRR